MSPTALFFLLFGGLSVFAFSGNIRALSWQERPVRAGGQLGTKRMTTVSAKPAEVRREWYVVDAQGKTLGRLATEIARRLKGKHKPIFTPHVDTGDYIVVVNAEKIHVTGNKLKDKMYHHHTGYIGNLKSINLEKQLQKAPERVIHTAVRGMLPRSPLGRAMMKKLRIYAGPTHNHQAQQPTALEV